MKTMLLLSMFLMTLPLRAELRTFKNTKGEEIKAEIIGVTGGRVELKREDGKKFSVPVSSLSEEDGKWITEWAKTHKHFKVQVAASIKKGNSREVEGDALTKTKTKGNDCWYALDLKNTAAEPLSGLRVEYIVFAASGSSVCGSVDVAAIPAGKTGQALTEKLFVPQATETAAVRAGSSGGTVQMTRSFESTLAGVHAELFLDGKPSGTFVSGKVPADAAPQLLAWREKQPPAKSEKPQ